MGGRRLRLLLDTHVFIWVGGPDAERLLSTNVRRAVEDPSTEILISAASAWEIATKHRLGRLEAGGRMVREWGRALTSLGASDLPITSEHGLLAGGFDAPNRDPFDRILAAQAIVEGARLVTTDRAMDGFGAELLW